jgi:ribosome-binding protein aMBF1 (putative translation factor)
MSVAMESSDPVIEDGCVNNLHKPPAVIMSRYRLSVCLAILGWPVSELARRIKEHRNTVQRWLDGKAAIDPAVAAWLEKLAAFHVANPSPAALKAHGSDVAASA